MKVYSLMLVTAVICVPDTERARADALRWVCKYDVMASPSGVKQESFKLEFALDTLTKRAILLGNAGVSDGAVFNGDQAITFEERLGTGAVQTTTISHTDGKSVHSRHSIMSGTFVPTQYYGICR